MKTNVEEPEVSSLSDEQRMMYIRKHPSKRFYVRKATVCGIGSFAFNVTLLNVYLIQSRTPNLGWWWGSVIINLRSGEPLPVLFFHDDESPSTLKHQLKKSKDFDPFSHNNPSELFYGGDQFFDTLRKYCVVERLLLEHSVYLINPTSEDLRAFAPINVVEEKSPVLASENWNRLLNGAKWSVLEGLAKISQLAKSNVKNVLDESPDVVKSMLQRPEVKRLGEDFGSANVYLAKWALSIQEEAEKNKRKYVLDDSYRNLLNLELGIPSIDALGAEELEKAQRTKEVSKLEWDLFFDLLGRLCITVDEVKERIFHGNVSLFVRPEAWLFLLGIYPWDSLSYERKQILKTLQADYDDYKSRWENNVEELSHDLYWKDQKTRIQKDINRNDRNVPLYRMDPSSKVDVESDHIEYGNRHLEALEEILLTFNQYNDNLGYVQGMCDILSVVYSIFQDKSISFWAFVKFMDRMERNFLKDQSGMKQQMETLNQLVSLMLPNLFLHLEKCDSINLFFFFRMLLVWFKREFVFDDTILLWECFLTDFHTSQFHLFFCLAILSKHEKIIIEHLSRFDEVLKYMNDLSLTLDKNDLLVRAELLFLRFQKMVDIIDRGILNDRLNKLRAEALANNRDKRNRVVESSLPHAYEITDDLRRLLSREVVVVREKKRNPNDRSE